MEFNTICVLGLGYIGLPTASTFANKGKKVIGVDINPDVVHSLQNGEVHIYEPGLGELVKSAVKSGKLVAQLRPTFADAFIIAVPTPFHDGKSANMDYVVAAAESIVPFLRKGNLVILESTSPPLTTQELLAPILEKSGLIAGQDFFLAYSPERVLPGRILEELIENARVIGGIDRQSAEVGRDLYNVFVIGDIILTDATTAEMVKLMENTTRDVNIAIANEFSRLADRFGIDVWEAIQIANLHPRIDILQPGPGVGGHCISVDPWFLVEKAPDLTKLIKTARQVNDGQPEFVVALTKRLMKNDLNGKTIAALGMTYKPNVDDMRESPALEVVKLLEVEGTQVFAYDPFANDTECFSGVQVSNDLESVMKDAEVLIFLVGHQILRSLKAEEVKHLTTAHVVLDTINILDVEEWTSNGFQVYRLGEGFQVA
ncbi:MAG: nucleotide sugar dehydrogenase [Anaerolineaceae bacterium]|nr:nucleotide sugar dehydrogenase [Anaerolineaceae bacterium]